MKLLLAVLLLTASTVAHSALPNGVVQLSTYGGLFPHPTTIYVEGCAADFTLCTSLYKIEGSSGSHFCTVANFPAMPTNGVCFLVPPEVAATQPFSSCYPDPDIQYSLTVVGFAVVPTAITSKNYWKVPVPSAYGSSYTDYWMWKDTCTNRVVGQFSNLSWLAKLLVAYTMQQLGDSSAVNRWAASQPVEALTAGEISFAAATLAPYNAPPVPPPVALYRVAKNGTVLTRPVYQRIDDTKRGTVEIGRVAVGDPCDNAVKSGTGGFYGVAGRPNLTVPGTTFPVGAVSGCALAATP